MIIKKKTAPKYFQDIADGKKNFEIRLADFQCQSGDVLVLEEWDSALKEYTGRRIEKKVKYVVNTKDLDFFSEEEIQKLGFQVIGFD